VGQRAAVMTAPGAPMEVWSRPDPTLEPGDLWLEIVASEVCGTDVHLHGGRLAGVPYPIIPGHVSVGRIVETRGVERDAAGRRLAAGDTVTFYDVHGTCHRCYYCAIARQPNLCRERRVYGITFGANEGLHGGWAESIHLKSGTAVFRLPDGLDADDVIGGGCGLFTGYGAVERADLTPGSCVVVQGTGPVGLSAVAFARLAGCGALVAIGDPDARLELARRMGADRAFSVSASRAADRLALVHEITEGRGADVVIEASGSPSAIGEGFRLMRDGGTYVIAGHYTDTGPVEINPHVDINRKHADVRGRWGTELHHVARSLELLTRHADRLPFADVIGGRYDLDETDRALADVAALRVTKAIVSPGR